MPTIAGKINTLPQFQSWMPEKISSVLNGLRSLIIRDPYLKILLLLTFIGFILQLYHLEDQLPWFCHSLPAAAPLLNS